jgi:hypothetical protein
VRETQPKNQPRSRNQATVVVDVDVDPKEAVAVAAWATHIAARAVWTAPSETPRWIAMVLALMYDLAAQFDQTDGEPVESAAKAGTPRPRGAAGGQGALVWGVLAERAASFLPADRMPAEPAAGRALDELGAARLAVDAADTLAVAQRVGDAEDIAHALGVYEQASLTYHLVAGRRPGGKTDG